MSGIVKKRVVRKKKYFITTVDKTLHRSRNSSIMTKKSLQSNNRALAKCLCQQKRENRNLTVELSFFIAERFELNQKIKRLEDELKSVLNGNWNPSHLEKIKTLKTILNQVSGNVLVTAQLINSVVDLFQDVEVNSCRTSSASTENRQIDSNPLNQLIIDSETTINKPQSNDDVIDLEVQKTDETNDVHKSPIDGPKAAFDLSAISEGSEYESRRSSVRSRLSIINHRRTKSIGQFETARQRRSRGSSVGSENDIWMTTPRSGETLEKLPRDFLTELSEKEIRRGDEIIEANQLSPFVKMNRIDDPKEMARRGTFVVVNSLQTAAWPPDDNITTRKSSKSSGKKQLSDGENKISPPNSTSSELNQVTNYEFNDMELTGVLHVPVELGEKFENPETLRTLVVSTKEKNVKNRSKQINAQQSAVLDDEVPGKKARNSANKERKRTSQSKQIDLEPFVVLEDVNRRTSSMRKTATRNSIVSADDHYDCDVVLEDAIDPREKFSTWKSKRSSVTDGKLSGKSSPIEEIEVLNINQTPKKRETKRTKTPKRKMRNEKENVEVNERPRRARNNVDYKLPSLTAKIRRDKDGSVIITKRVSDSSATENDSLSFIID